MQNPNPIQTTYLGKTTKQQPISHPIGYYYSSRTHPLPQEVEAYLERLPLAQKISLATAILNQCNTVFSNIPTNHKWNLPQAN